jgi:hypothetical protein
LFDNIIYKNNQKLEFLNNGVIVWYGKYSTQTGIAAGEEHLEAWLY